MNIVHNEDDLVVVSLSERNLNGLLEQFLASGKAEAQIMRVVESGARLIVTVESDSAHYHAAGRDGRAGHSSSSQTYGEVIARA